MRRHQHAIQIGSASTSQDGWIERGCRGKRHTKCQIGRQQKRLPGNSDSGAELKTPTDIITLLSPLSTFLLVGTNGRTNVCTSTYCDLEQCQHNLNLNELFFLITVRFQIFWHPSESIVEVSSFHFKDVCVQCLVEPILAWPRHLLTMTRRPAHLNSGARGLSDSDTIRTLNSPSAMSGTTLLRWICLGHVELSVHCVYYVECIHRFSVSFLDLSILQRIRWIYRSHFRSGIGTWLTDLSKYHIGEFHDEAFSKGTFGKFLYL